MARRKLSTGFWLQNSFCFLIVFCSSFFFKTMEDVKQDIPSDSIPRSLIPRILLKEEPGYGEEYSFEEIRGKILSRSKHPIARLTNFNSDSDFQLNDVFSLKLKEFESDLENVVTEKEVSYVAISSIRYVINQKDVFVTTCWMSPFSQKLKYRLDGRTVTGDGAVSGKKIVFNNGIEALTFHQPNAPNLENQIVFVKDNKYYITIGSSLSIPKLQKLIEKYLVLK
jgi:hypothetical protein